MKGNQKITIALVGMACLCSNLPTMGYAKDGGDGKVVPGIVNSKPRHNVKGTVKDSDGEPIIGANVYIEGRRGGTVTDIDGNFNIQASDDDVLNVSYIGFKKQLCKVNGERINIKLIEDNKTLNEVVVVGYGTQKKTNLTGAVDQVGSEVFDNRSVSNVTQALQGAVPNLNITLTDGKPTRSASFNVRGTTSIG